MSKEEIIELMALRDWSKAKLAAELGLGENIVYRWLKGEREPGGPATVLMTIWLKETREYIAHKKRK